jgi:hypothetical protein
MRLLTLAFNNLKFSLYNIVYIVVKLYAKNKVGFSIPMLLLTDFFELECDIP